MRCKRASLVINPRTGQNAAKITDVLAVLAAAGWKTDIALKEYGGHTMELANEASKDSCDLIIAYGGDGTLNQVVNGVMNTKKRQGIVGVIPGGTANVWAGEIGIPGDPVKAALALVDSEERKVDVGHVAVQRLSLPGAQQATDEDKQKRKGKASKKARQHFLLMAGLGIDAAIMEGVSKPLKYRVGPLAVGFSAAKELPAQHTFPIDIEAGTGEGEVLWKGEALQVVIGNTRRYAAVAEMTPQAYIDDGVLDVCVITGGNPVTTVQQVVSLLMRRKPDNTTAEYFHGTHLRITVPTSVPMQLDGSAVKLKDYLDKKDYAALQQLGDDAEAVVTYQFDALPHALALAIPRSYDEALFEHSNGHEEPHANKGVSEKSDQHTDEQPVEKTPQQEAHADEQSNEKHEVLPEVAEALMQHGRPVTVIGQTPNPEKKQGYIIAGGMPKPSTGETRPVAVVVNGKTAIFDHKGKYLSSTAVQELSEGAIIYVEGKKTKRGVIEATQLVI